MLLLFSTFFYLIWLWYLGLLPLAVFIFMLAHWFKNVFNWVNLEFLWEKWSLILIRLLTMIWISWILFFVWLQEISVYLVLLVLNIFLWMGSHIFRYNDWQLIFEIWTWVVDVIILGTCLFSGWFFVCCEVFSLLAALMLWLYAFLQFIIWLFFPVDKKWTYEIFLLLVVVLWSAIIKYFYPSWWIMSLCFLMLMMCYLWIYMVQHWEMPSKEMKIISVRRILAWERIFKKVNVSGRKISLYDWLFNAPNWFIRLFEFCNIGVLLFKIFSTCSNKLCCLCFTQHSTIFKCVTNLCV